MEEAKRVLLLVKKGHDWYKLHQNDSEQVNRLVDRFEEQVIPKCAEAGVPEPLAWSLFFYGNEFLEYEFPNKEEIKFQMGSHTPITEDSHPTSENSSTQVDRVLISSAEKTFNATASIKTFGDQAIDWYLKENNLLVLPPEADKQEIYKKWKETQPTASQLPIDINVNI